MMTQSVIAAALAKRKDWPLKQPSPKKFSFPWRATTASFPNSDMTLDLTVLDVKDRIRCVALGENLLILSIVRHAPAAVHSA
jgi:hypothetical protein